MELPRWLVRLGAASKALTHCGGATEKGLET
jgi:hypothetical protein